LRAAIFKIEAVRRIKYCTILVPLRKTMSDKTPIDERLSSFFFSGRILLLAFF
jgi:hypothetical protein